MKALPGSGRLEVDEPVRCETARGSLKRRKNQAAREGWIEEHKVEAIAPHCHRIHEVQRIGRVDAHLGRIEQCLGVPQRGQCARVVLQQMHFRGSARSRLEAKCAATGKSVQDPRAAKALPPARPEMTEPVKHRLPHAVRGGPQTRNRGHRNLPRAPDSANDPYPTAGLWCGCPQCCLAVPASDSRSTRTIRSVPNPRISADLPTPQGTPQMFGFFRRKKPEAEEAPPPAPEGKTAGSGLWSFIKGLTRDSTAEQASQSREIAHEDQPALPAQQAHPAPPAQAAPTGPTAALVPSGATTLSPEHAASVSPTAPAPAPAHSGSEDAAPSAAQEQGGGWLARLKRGLSKTRGQLAGFFGLVEIDEALLEDLEAAMICADVGVAASQSLIAELRARIKSLKLRDGESVRRCLRQILVERLRVLEGGIDLDRVTPLVIMIAGVNGAGKTTSIGKLARHVQREGKTVLLAAGDTFRAAAREQLTIWGQRNGVDVIAQQGGDPAAVAFDAVSAGKARRSGVVMIDTAGRLPTQAHLMEELRKIRKVIGKAMPEAPHESLLILDGNTGQNMLYQFKAFHEVAELTGLVVTKLDGTAKGGALLALAHQVRERPLPVYFIGIGEGLDDLQPFRAEEFASALLDQG